MFGNIIQRMIFREITKVFLLSLLGLTGILLMAGIVAEATQQGLSPTQVLAIIPLLIPSTLPYTIPATTLFATCVVYGRLSADNEILALRAAGVNLLMVVWPGVLLGVAMSLSTMGLYYYLIPYTHNTMRNMFLQDIEESLYTVIRKDHCLNQPRLNYAMWVRQVQGRKLLGALFKRRDEKGNYDVVAWAREADLRVDIHNKLIKLRMRNGLVTTEGGTSGYFEDRLWDVPLPALFGMDRAKRPRAMTWMELIEHRQEMAQAEADTAEEIALTQAKIPNTPQPNDLPQHLKNLQDRKKMAHFELLQCDTEIYMRPALSLGCLCFVLVGCPVGIWFSRSDYLSAFMTCFLPIVFLYYPLMLCGTNLAKDGKIGGVLPIFAADIVVALVGLVFFRRLMRN